MNGRLGGRNSYINHDLNELVLVIRKFTVSVCNVGLLVGLRVGLLVGLRVNTIQACHATSQTASGCSVGHRFGHETSYAIVRRIESVLKFSSNFMTSLCDKFKLQVYCL